MKILIVVGARPNFMKAAPIIAATHEHNRSASGLVARHPWAREPIHALLVHTGQHYDAMMSDAFFRDLEIPEPNVYLGVGSGTHAAQTAAIMQAFEPVIVKERPDWVIVVGDVNSTIACALVCAKLGVKVAHVEAGLRSRDRTMPEEINRVLTDQIADLLLTPSLDANENLRAEGIPKERIRFVGNIMIDSLLVNLDRAKRSTVRADLDLEHRNYAVLTLHRPSNVDEKISLGRILSALEEIARRVPIVFPAHPRTRKMIDELGLAERIKRIEGLLVVDPVGYLDFLQLLSNSCLVLTDSGGIQEETTVLGIPCVTLRENTERPITVEIGTNTIAGTDRAKIVDAAIRALDNPPNRSSLRIPPLWDGRTADRILDALAGKS